MIIEVQYLGNQSVWKKNKLRSGKNVVERSCLDWLLSPIFVCCNELAVK